MLPGITPQEELSIPGITAKIGTSAHKYMQDYSVKYFKGDLDDLGDLTFIQDIETRAIRGEDIVILTKDHYSFMAQYFIIISYMEKNT